MLPRMAPTISAGIPVVDFRRQSMVLQWNAADGTWIGYDDPPALVHGVALIRAVQPNICLFARDGWLHLQAGIQMFPLAEHSPRVRWSRGSATFGLRRRFTVEQIAGSVLYSHAYWGGQGDDFFSWMASRTADPGWRETAALRWTEGVQPAVLRSS